MSKTTPVRWWRDDATRYATRGPQLVPAQPMPEWAFDLIAKSEPANIARVVDELRNSIATALYVPRELWGTP